MTFNKKDSGDDYQLEVDPADAADFEKMLQQSFDKKEKRLGVGEKIRAEVLSVGKENIIVSTGTRMDGFVSTKDLLDENGKPKVKSGEFIELFVTSIQAGHVNLSPKANAQTLADDIGEAYANNQLVSGKVESINKGGFQVLIFGKLAFCPISQIDLKFVEKPEDYLGKKFEFKVTQYTEGGRNIVVSRRKVLEEGKGAATALFKEQIKDKMSPGSEVTGKVTRVETFGAFIEIAPGIEGMAHVSELSWARVNNPNDVIKVGDTVTAKILRIDQEERRMKISLSLKNAASDPWANLPSQVQTGRVVGGKITKLMPFGAFVEIVPGIEGLIPLSEMSSTKRINTADEVVKPGQEVSVLVKNIDLQSKRISLSLKGALEEAASASEAQDINEYAASQKERESNSSVGDFAAKMQAALTKKK